MLVTFRAVGTQGRMSGTQTCLRFYALSLVHCGLNFVTTGALSSGRRFQAPIGLMSLFLEGVDLPAQLNSKMTRLCRVDMDTAPSPLWDGPIEIDCFHLIVV